MENIILKRSERGSEKSETIQLRPTNAMPFILFTCCQNDDLMIGSSDDDEVLMSVRHVMILTVKLINEMFFFAFYIECKFFLRVLII